MSVRNAAKMLRNAVAELQKEKQSSKISIPSNVYGIRSGYNEVFDLV